MQITGQITVKLYECTDCGAQEKHSTNHYGDIYNIRCGVCSPRSPWWKRLKVFRCVEPLPEGWAKPEPWKTVTLGDIATIEGGKQ